MDSQKFALVIGLSVVCVVIAIALVVSVVLVVLSSKDSNSSSNSLCPIQSTNWNNRAKIQQTNEASYEQGKSISENEDFLVIAGPEGNNTIGKVWIYRKTPNQKKSNTTFEYSLFQTLDCPEQTNGAAFGIRVAISIEENHLLVSATGVSIGTVYFYQYNQTSNQFDLKQNLVGEGWKTGRNTNGSLAQVGNALAISPDGLICAIGAPNNDNNLGGVAMFQFNAEKQEWIQEFSANGSKLLEPSEPLKQDRFGEKVALNFDGQRVFITNKASVQIFDRNNGVWSVSSIVPIESIDSKVVFDNGRLANSICCSFDGNTFLIPASTEDNRYFLMVYRYDLNDNVWVCLSQQEIKIKNNKTQIKSLSCCPNAKVIAIGCSLLPATLGGGFLLLQQQSDTKFKKLTEKLASNLSIDSTSFFGESISCYSSQTYKMTSIVIGAPGTDNATGASFVFY